MSNVFKINSSVITYFYFNLKKEIVRFVQEEDVCFVYTFRIICTFKLEAAKCHLFTIFLQKFFLVKAR